MFSQETYKITRQELRRSIRAELALMPAKSETELRQYVNEQVNRALLGKQVDLRFKRSLMQDLYFSLRGLDILQPLMDDACITEIMVNGPFSIFIEKEGKILETPLAFDDRQHLTDLITHFFSNADKNINLSRPIEDLRLEDGSRANAVLPPLAPDGPILTIRKFTGIRPDADALLQSAFVGKQTLDMLQSAVCNKESIFICGGTGSGKTSLLNILSSFIRADERVVTIEDSAELQLQGLPNLVRLESRAPTPDGQTAYGIAALIRTALRMRPDRIIVGEVRGAEAFDLLTAMNSGHPGTLSTGHANSCADMMRRLANMILSASTLPYAAILENLASSVNLLIHVQRCADGQRRIDEICRVIPDGQDRYHLLDLPLDS